MYCCCGPTTMPGCKMKRKWTVSAPVDEKRQGKTTHSADAHEANDFSRREAILVDEMSGNEAARPTKTGLAVDRNDAVIVNDAVCIAQEFANHLGRRLRHLTWMCQR